MTGTTVIAFSSGTNDLILGLAAAVLVVFALVVSMVIPRRRPDFPGRSVGAFLAVALLLVIGMLAAVEALGESHDFSAHEEAAATEPTTTSASTTGPTASTATETGQTATTGQTQTGGAAAGNPAAGKQVFDSAGCSGCHTLKEAGANGTVGPNLDDHLKGKTAAFIKQSIVDPNAEITSGYPPNVMPQNFDQTLSATQLADLVAFLDQVAKG